APSRMTLLSPPPVPAPPAARGSPARRGPAASVWLAPLVPDALAFTAGIVLDRYTPLAPGFALLTLAAALLAWAAAAVGRKHFLGLVYLWGGVGMLGALRHHVARERPAADDIATHATTEPRPAALRGLLDSEPA